MSRDQRDVLHFRLDSAVTKGASFSSPRTDLNLDRFTELVVTFQITSAERDSANETYDLYIITGDGLSEWDLVHFPQVATTGAKTFTARLTSQNQIPTNVTTASPGVSANDSAIFQTDTAGSNQGIKTLSAGIVRHAPWGNTIGYELVCAGTITTGIVFSLQVQAR